MRIFGISGKAGAGKTLFARHAISLVGGTKISMADAVKEECADFLTYCLVPFEPRHLYGTQADRTEEFSVLYTDWMRVEYAPRKVIGPHMRIDGDSLKMTYRALMQYWGTEFRRGQDVNYWVRKAKEKIDKTEGLVFIDDIRFESEANMVLRAGGAVIRVDRPGGPFIDTPWHESETALDNFLHFTLHLDNDKDINHYFELVARVLRFLL